MRRLAILLASFLLPAGAAQASIWVASGTSAPSLKVDAKGLAEMSWIAGGKRESLFVPPRGQAYHGGSLSGPDVSRMARVPGLALAKLVRRTPDGYLWALQEWQVQPGRPPELHLSRWKGAPTALTLNQDGDILSGTATFQGRPVAGFSTTPEGKRLRVYVYLDCFGCTGGKGGWLRMIGVAPRADGSFRVFVKPTWKGTLYRATVAGPNIGTTRAPDAQTQIAAG